MIMEVGKTNASLGAQLERLSTASAAMLDNDALMRILARNLDMRVIWVALR